MKALETLFGESPFKHLVEHARKIHACVNLVRPIADAIVEGDMARLVQYQDEMSKMEYEADQLKDSIRQKLPHRFFLPVAREDVLNFVRQLDRMGDDAEDFAVVATFRRIKLPGELRTGFLALVDKTIQTSEALLASAEQLAPLQEESFEGAGADQVLEKIQEVCRLEWESDKLSRDVARRYYSAADLDAVNIILLEKLCRALTSIADHAENVGKSLRLMILRR